MRSAVLMWHPKSRYPAAPACCLRFYPQHPLTNVLAQHSLCILLPSSSCQLSPSTFVLVQDSVTLPSCLSQSPVQVLLSFVKHLSDIQIPEEYSTPSEQQNHQSLLSKSRICCIFAVCGCTSACVCVHVHVHTHVMRVCRSQRTTSAAMGFRAPALLTCQCGSTLSPDPLPALFVFETDCHCTAYAVPSSCCSLG